MNNLLAVFTVGLLTVSFSYGQSTPATQSETPGTSQNEKMKTLFSGAKKPLKKINYLGISAGAEMVYGTLAGAFTPMAGVSGMLHVNKKWGVGLAGYSTIGEQFAPKLLSSTQALNLSSMYGGLKLEYTLKPNSVVHLSFPLLIGGVMSKVDSVGSRNKLDGEFDRGNKEGRGKENGRNDYGEDASFLVIQPGINIEVNVFRFAKVFAGASYRIVPTVMKENNTASLLPTPTAGQLGGLNLSAGLKIGFFDYQLHQAKRRKKQKPGAVQ